MHESVIVSLPWPVTLNIIKLGNSIVFHQFASYFLPDKKVQLILSLQWTGSESHEKGRKRYIWMERFNCLILYLELWFVFSQLCLSLNLFIKKDQLVHLRWIKFDGKITLMNKSTRTNGNKWKCTCSYSLEKKKTRNWCRREVKHEVSFLLFFFFFLHLSILKGGEEVVSASWQTDPINHAHPNMINVQYD